MSTAGPGAIRSRLADLATAIPVLVLVLVGTHESAEHQSNLLRDLDPIAWTLAALAAASVTIWRIMPVGALAFAGTVTTGYLGAGYPWGPVVLPLALTSVGAALRVPADRSLRPALAVLALVTGGMAARFAQDPGTSAAIEIVTAPGWLAVPFAVGMVIRVRWDAAARARSDEAERAAAAERLRIAAEVHDVAGHGLAVIAMQAGVALHVLERRPEQARIALEEIRAASTEALAGLRSTLGELRSDDAPTTPGPPGLDALDALVERIRRAGLPIDLLRAGSPPDAVPAELGRAAYRIVQESLTNVLRHASAQRAAVRLNWSPDRLELQVEDDGMGPTGPEAAGIAGMRERALALGGSVRTGPGRGGGFEVRAVLPVPR